MINGIEALAASCSRVLCENTRAATTSTQRERLRATSGTDSRLPIPISCAARYTAAPPSWIIATSKVTRVRSDGFSKMSAIVRPGSGVERSRALVRALSSDMSAKRRGRSSRARSRIERKCFTS